MIFQLINTYILVLVSFNYFPSKSLLEAWQRSNFPNFFFFLSYQQIMSFLIQKFKCVMVVACFQTFCHFQTVPGHGHKYMLHNMWISWTPLPILSHHHPVSSFLLNSQHMNNPWYSLNVINRQHTCLRHFWWCIFNIT